MLDLEQRVARVEGRVEGHVRMLTDVAAAVRHLEARMEQRFAGLDARFTALEQRFEQKLDDKVGALDRKLEAGFFWIVGIQFAILIALVASVITR